MNTGRRPYFTDLIINITRLSCAVQTEKIEMPQNFGNPFEHRPPHRGGPLISEPARRPIGAGEASLGRRQTYSKVFRWRLPDGQTQEPSTVELVGSFTHWQKVALVRDGTLDAWHVTVHHIEGNRTHHYMLLVNGKPVQDKNADGLAFPHGPQEEQYSLITPRGPRLFMLFAQAK
jgi:hypothetical protein